MLARRESALPGLVCVGLESIRCGEVRGDGGDVFISLGRADDCREMLMRSLLELGEPPRKEPDELERPEEEFRD